MDAYECIITKLDIREYSVQNVPSEKRQKILDAARLTGTGLNTQHWKFILVEKERIFKNFQASTSGNWIAGANFAIIVLTNPKLNFI
jgi:nitroreductase